MKQITVALIFCLTMPGLTAWARPAAVYSVTASKKTAAAGEPVSVVQKLVLSEPVEIDWSVAQAALTNVLVLRSALTQNQQGGQWVVERNLLLTLPDSGSLALDRLAVVVKGSGQPDTLRAQVAAVTFHAETPITQLHDLKPQQPVIITFYRQPLFFFPVLGLALLGASVWSFIRFRKKREVPVPDELPLQQLQTLEKQLKKHPLRNDEVTTRLISLLQATLENDAPFRATAHLPAKLTRKLRELQFGPAAAETFRETALLGAVQRLLETQVAEEEVTK